MINFRIMVSILSLAIAGICLASKDENYSSSQIREPVFDLSQVSQEEVQQFFEHPSSFILFCPEGLSLPLNLFLKGDLIELEGDRQSTMTLVTKHPFYLHFQDDQILLSLNGIEWKTWQDFFTGILSLSIDAQSNSPYLHLGAEMYLK